MTWFESLDPRMRVDDLVRDMNLILGDPADLN